MPQKGKAKNAPNQHDKRHENGLAPPGKRIVRQRSSNGQLNGHPNGKPTPAVSPPALPSTGLNQGFKFPRPADPSAVADSSSTTSSFAAARDHAAGADVRERDRTPSDASAEDVGPCGEMADTAREHVSALSSDHVSPAKTPCRDHDRHGRAAMSSPLSAVSTILAYYPLRDAIAILILLLSLPPTLVLVIQTLFASLTFVPPTAGLSLSTLPNLKEVFSSSNFGYPALFTILLCDLVFGLAWLMCPKSLQAIVLDLSQAVIALSLSGAAASTSGPTYSVATCSIIVCVVHVLRYRAIHLTALDYLRSVLHKMDISIPFDVSFLATQSHSATPFERGMAFGFMRAFLGIHILSQGITTCVRRTIANRKANEKDPNVPAITKTDTEATAGSDPSSRLTSGHADGSPHPHSGASSDGRPPGQPPAHRESKQRESNSKKKRKQANQVRSQQPLWAAIASTKVTFVKEMEQRDAADDAREAAVMDNNTTNPFASATNSTTDRIWICEVRDTEIYFAVELSPETVSANVDAKDESVSSTSGIDKSKPFFMRINGATWSSTRIMSSEEEGKSAGDRYLGEIFGLAPLSSYHCEVVSLGSQRVLCSASLITQPAPTAEQAAAPAPPQHQALRPASPITTLKQSIQSAEAKLNDIRNRSKKTKKDHRAAQAEIKKEINLLKTKLDSSGGVDDKQEKRLQQITQHKNQAEEATANFKKEIEALGDLPADEVEASRVKRRAWQSALDAKKAAERDRDNAKAQQLREVEALRSDIASSVNKREKLQARNNQRAQDLEKASQKQRDDLTAKQKRDEERAQTLKVRQAKAQQFQSLIATSEQEAQIFQSKGQDAWQQASALSNWSSQAATGYGNYSTPPTPEGPLPNSNGQISPQANGFPPGAFGPHHFNSPFNTAAVPANVGPANAAGGPRGRSSSMFSQYSGFTDPGDDYMFETRQQHSWPVQSSATPGAEERKGSDGDNASGSGSGGASAMNGSTNGSNSPRPDAKPFVPGKAVGTIGPPGRKTPQSPSSMHSGAVGSGR